MSLRAPAPRGASLFVGGEERPLVSGALHYFRIDPEHWAAALDALVALGLRIVESYVPWAVHERAAGRYDFGEELPQNDLGRFLDLAAERGLGVVLRPGPHVNAELECFGIPRRVVEDPSCQALSPARRRVLQPFPPRMFPVPSHASGAYLAEVGAWFDAVGKALRGRLHPEGPVVALQVDNEVGGFFRNGPYCQDYHPDAIAAYRADLASRYGSVVALASAHGPGAASFDEVEPPTRFDATHFTALPPHLDWARFQEELASRSIARMRARLVEAGLGSVPTLHNVAMGETALPLRLPDLAETVDVVGLDHYHSAAQLDGIARRVRRSLGTLGYAYAPELGVGGPSWFTPFPPEDSLFALMAAVAYGLRGFNLYMAVARDRWYGAPIDENGASLPEAAPLAAFLSAFRELEVHRLDIPTPIALVIPAEYARLARVTHLLGPIGPSTLEALGGAPTDACLGDPLGFASPIQLGFWSFLDHLSRALDEAAVPHVFVDGDARRARFEGYRRIVSPSYEMADPERLRSLCHAARLGARVSLGPRLPERDLAMQLHAFELPGGFETITVDSRDDARSLVARWLRELGHRAAVTLEPAALRWTLHYRDGRPALLFLLNPHAVPCEAQVTVAGRWTLRDAITGERYDAAPDARVPMLGKQVRMLAVTPEAARPVTGGRTPRARRPRS